MLSMIKSFFTEYTPEGQTHSVKSLSLIAKHYFAKGFVPDLIAILPIPFVLRGRHELIKLFYLVKIVRMARGIELFEGSAFMGAVKTLAQRRMEKQIEEDPIFAEDYINDHTNIERLLFISYGIKTIKLIILIMNISYFVGMIWLIYSEITMDIIYRGREWLSAADREHLHADFFIEVYSLENFIEFETSSQSYTIGEKTIIAGYFAFTSLTTVGFGDYTPQSDPERLLCSFILLIGVAIFSFIMGNFIEILD